MRLPSGEKPCIPTLVVPSARNSNGSITTS